MQLNQWLPLALLTLTQGHSRRVQSLFLSLSYRIAELSFPALTSCLFASALLANSCGPAQAGALTANRVIETGMASYYGRYFQGRRTSSGRRYNPWKLTAASPSLPLGSKVRVTASNGRSVDVVVTDRMAAPRRVIDLSYQAAQMLGMLRQGVTYVTLARP